jgi:hypothetical protein
MATRSKIPRKQKAEGSGQKALGGEQQTGGESGSLGGTELVPDDKSAPAIRKGVYLSALVYVEGDLPAPEDFTTPATSALKEVLGEAFKAKPGGLNLTLKKVDVQNDLEQEEAEEGKGAGEEKFQF